MNPGVFFARDGARPTDDSEPAPVETDAATLPEAVRFPAIHQINKALAQAVTIWSSKSSIAMMIEDTGEVCVGADTFAFKSWRPTKHWLLRPDGPGKDLEIRLSDIESVRLDRIIRPKFGCTWFLCVILQYRTADGGSGDVWLTGSRSQLRIPKLHDAIAARLAARK